MNRKEYMERLEQLLLALPEEEREEALQYYTDYFDDAGAENEEKVISELGSPEEVAAKIRAGFAGEYGEYSEQGFEDSRFHKNKELITGKETVEGIWEDIPNQKQENKKKKAYNNTNIWKVIAIILIVLFAAPVILPVGMAVLVVIVTLIIAVIVTIIAVLLGIGVSGFAILFAGIAVIVAGIARILLAPAEGILATGVGCILFAIGILLSWIMISVMVKVIPGAIRGMVKVLGAPFRKAGVR